MMRSLRSLFLLALLLLSACRPAPTPPPPTPTATSTATPTTAGRPLRLALVYARSAEEDATLYLRAGLYHRLRLMGFYRGDGTLQVEEFVLHIEPRTSDEEVDAKIQSVLEALGRGSYDMVITLGGLATARIAPVYAVEHVTTPVLYADVPSSQVEALRRYPSVVGLPHGRYPIETMRLAMEMSRAKPISRVLVLGSGADALEATSAYAQLQEAFPTVDFTLYTTERFVVWQQILETEAKAVDMVLLISWEGLRDDRWRFVNERHVLTWTILNAPVPLFALDERAVRLGAVGGLVASVWREGEMLARMVVEVHRGTHPSALSAEGRSSDLLAVNLRGVARWNLSLPTPVTLLAVKYSGYPAGGSAAGAAGGEP